MKGKGVKILRCFVDDWLPAIMLIFVAVSAAGLSGYLVFQVIRALIFKR